MFTHLSPTLSTCGLVPRHGYLLEVRSCNGIGDSLVVNYIRTLFLKDFVGSLKISSIFNSV